MPHTRFTWLHLTDLHCGMSNQDWQYPRLKARLFADLERLYEKTGAQPWDLVLFTGDLVQSGKAEEFKLLDDRLEELWDVFNKIDSHNNPKLLSVPGNHDLVRPTDIVNESEEMALEFLHQWQKNETAQQRFWEKDNSFSRKLVKDAFENYENWLQKCRFIPKNLKRGLLPGDFAYTLEKNGVKLGVLGLNTTFLQLKDGDYQGKLALHSRQFHTPFQNSSQNSDIRDGSDWAKQHQTCLLLTHHPKNWLDDDSKNQLSKYINQDGQFVFHLCGHMHEPKYQVTSEGGKKPYRTWLGRSLFGLEYFFNKNGEKNQRSSYGYSLGCIDILDEEQGQVYFYPLKDKDAGFRPDDDNIFLREDNSTDPIQFKLSIKNKKKTLFPLRQI